MDLLNDVVLNIALVALLGVSTALASVVSAARGARNRLRRRRTQVIDALRPAVMLLAGGDPDDVDEARTTLMQVDARRWAAVAPSVVSLLTKLRGESHRALVELLQARGTLAEHLRRLGDRSAVQRATAAEMLGASGTVEAVAGLIDCLRDRDDEVRQVAARALGRIADPDAIGPLLATLGSDRPVPPRIIAASAARCAANAHDALKPVLAQGSPTQQAIAAEVCGMTGARQNLPLLIDLLLSDGRDGRPAVDLDVRIRAARSIGRLGLPRVVPDLVAAAAPGQPGSLRAVAAKALGEVGSSDAVPALAELAVDSDDRVAVNASAALVRCGAAGSVALRAVAGDPAHLQANEALLMARLRRQLSPTVPRPRNEVEFSTPADAERRQP